MFVRVNKGAIVNTDHIIDIKVEQNSEGKSYPAKVWLDGNNSLPEEVDHENIPQLIAALEACNTICLGRGTFNCKPAEWFLDKEGEEDE